MTQEDFFFSPPGTKDEFLLAKKISIKKKITLLLNAQLIKHLDGGHTAHPSLLMTLRETQLASQSDLFPI